MKFVVYATGIIGLLFCPLPAAYAQYGASWFQTNFTVEGVGLSASTQSGATVSVNGYAWNTSGSSPSLSWSETGTGSNGTGWTYRTSCGASPYQGVTGYASASYVTAVHGSHFFNVTGPTTLSPVQVQVTVEVRFQNNLAVNIAGMGGAADTSCTSIFQDMSIALGYPVALSSSLSRSSPGGGYNTQTATYTHVYTVTISPQGTGVLNVNLSGGGETDASSSGISAGAMFNNYVSATIKKIQGPAGTVNF